MAANFTLKIITPEAIVFTAEVDSLLAPGKLGAFEVLKGHAFIINQLVSGSLFVKMADGARRVFATHHGYLEVRGRDVTLLVDAAEPAEKIDVNRARESVKRARERMAQKDGKDLNLDRLQLALARSLARLQAAGAKEEEMAS